MPNKKSTKSLSKKSGYAKRPLWHWVALYLIIGGILYLMVYYFLLKGNGYGSNMNYGYSDSYTVPVNIQQQYTNP